MLQVQDEASNKHELSSVDSLLPIESKDIKPLEYELEGSQYEVAEEDELEVEDPALIQTKHDFVTSPWSRLGIIGGAFGAGFLVIFVVLNGMMNGGGKNAKKPEVTPTLTPTVAASEKKDGDVYAKLALAKQQEELDALNGKGKTEDKEEKKEATEEEQSKNKEKTRSIRQRRVVAQETPPTSRRRVYREEAPETVRPRRREVASQPIAPLRPSAPLPKFAKQIVASNQSVAKDPIAELERLRSLGSVGRVDYMLASTTVSEPTNTTVQEVTAKTEETLRPAEQNTSRSRRRRNRRSENTETVTNTPSQIEELRPRWEPVNTNDSTPEYSNTGDEENNQAVPVIYSFSVEKLQTSSELGSSKEKILESSFAGNKENNPTQQVERVANNYLPEEAQILQETQPQYLVVGSFASATLVTPLVMPQINNNGRSQEQTNTLRFVARLNEPLYSNTGEIAIPAGTQVTIAMISVDSTSGVRAEVTAILKDGTEYPISPGTISVLGEAGSPLAARPYDDKGSEIAKYDTTLGTIAGLAKVGEIINQPDEEVTEDLPLGGTRTRSRNNNRNLGAAFLEGAFGKLGETVSKRTERATDEINRRPNVWYVPKDTKITIKVDRSIKL
ncbi:TrbI/VirB10 family protein [Nostoc sp.]|uniref:TrbI/VirB10 family protein n=1 Tax=Nostoc sp. TaxID=1180 RepID=UPI002FF4BC81